MTLLLWILIALQLLMGAFDTLIHHEFLEKLAWRQSQRKELRLHGIRNLIYGFFFATLGFLIPQGGFAWLLIGVLAAELCITLIDFVEEDRTRKLPASERVTHTLMALNYGAILALVIPVLYGYAQQPTGLIPSDYGLWSLMMAVSAVGVTLFGLRDLHAASRLKRLSARSHIVELKPSHAPKTVLVTGGTGFIGKMLVPSLLGAGHAVIVLTRNPANASQFSGPVTVVTRLSDLPASSAIDVIINLAGAPVTRLWTRAHKREMMDSRLGITQDINRLIGRLTRKPELLISGSANGVYGANPEGLCTETSPVSLDGGFAQQLCRSWEAEADQSGIRTVKLRIGIALDFDGGSLGQMLVPTELGGGAIFGDGSQMMSWISRRDLVRMIGFIMDHGSIAGPVNAVAPNPVSNKVFTKAMSRRLFRPALLHIPGFLFHLLGGLGREIFLSDQYVLPETAIEAGFQFEEPEIEAAFDHIFVQNMAPKSATADQPRRPMNIGRLRKNTP